MKAATLAVTLIAAAIVIQQTTSVRTKGKPRFIVGKPGAHFVGNTRKQDRYAHRRTPKAPGAGGNQHSVNPAAHLQGSETDGKEVHPLTAPGPQLGEAETTGKELPAISQATGPGQNGIPGMSAGGMPGMMNGMGPAGYPGMMSGMGGYGGMMDPMGVGPGMGMGMGWGMGNGMGNNMMMPMVVGQLGQALGRAAASIARAVTISKRNAAAAAAASSRPWNMGYHNGGGGAYSSTLGGSNVMEPFNPPEPAGHVADNSTEANSTLPGKNIEEEYNALKSSEDKKEDSENSTMYENSDKPQGSEKDIILHNTGP